MLDTTTFVGLDVHARSIKAVSLDVMTGEVRAATFGYDAGAVAEWVRSVDPWGGACTSRGHGLRPAEEAFRLGGRLRGRRRLEDDQAQRGQAQEERPQRRRVPRPHAVGRQRGRGVGPRRRVRGRPRPDRALEDARDDLSRSKQRLSSSCSGTGSSSTRGRPPAAGRATGPGRTGPGSSR